MYCVCGKKYQSSTIFVINNKYYCSQKCWVKVFKNNWEKIKEDKCLEEKFKSLSV
jgi:hypothetical protein